MGVEPEGVVVLTGVAALDAEEAVRSGGWVATSRTGTKEQDARARARAARLALLADRIPVLTESVVLAAARISG